MEFPMWILWVIVGLIAFECLCRFVSFLEQKHYEKRDKENG